MRDHIMMKNIFIITAAIFSILTSSVSYGKCWYINGKKICEPPRQYNIKKPPCEGCPNPWDFSRQDKINKQHIYEIDKKKVYNQQHRYNQQRMQ
jgi:hypothetical protein